MKTKKLAVLMAFAALAAKAQSNAITLCDQQSGTKHCVTIKAPVSLPADFTCTTSTTGLGSCAGDVYAGFTVTDKTAVNAGSPPSSTNGLQVWHDPSTHESVILNLGGKLSIKGSSTGTGDILLLPGNSGFVGIGTSTPANLLHAYSATAATLVKLETNGVFSALLFKDATDSVGIGSISGNFVLQTNSTERMRIVRTTGLVGFGTQTPDSKLSVNNNAATPPTFSTSEVIAHFTGTNSPPSVASRILLDSFQGEPLFTTRRANGTNASPTAIQFNDLIGGWSAYGYGATSYGSGGRANLLFGAEENWTDTAQGTFISLWTNANGTLTKAERMRINNVGYMGIGTTAPASKLDVSGALTIDSGCHPGFVSGSLGIDVCGGVVRMQGGLSFPMDIAMVPFGGHLGVGTVTAPEMLTVAGNMAFSADNTYSIASFATQPASIYGRTIQSRKMQFGDTSGLNTFWYHTVATASVMSLTFNDSNGIAGFSVATTGTGAPFTKTYGHVTSLRGDNLDDQGSSSVQWRNLYLGTGLYMGGTQVINSSGLWVGNVNAPTSVRTPLLVVNALANISPLGGSGTRCLQVNNSGDIGIFTGGCGSASGVSSLSATSPIAVSGSTGAINITCTTCITTAGGQTIGDSLSVGAFSASSMQISGTTVVNSSRDIINVNEYWSFSFGKVINSAGLYLGNVNSPSTVIAPIILSNLFCISSVSCGITQTITIRNAAGTATCQIAFNGGIALSTTC